MLRKGTITTNIECIEETMRRSIITPRLTLAALVLASAPIVRAQGKPDAHAHGTARFAIPESMRHEHSEIHAALERATREPGRVGAAARDLAKVLGPHFAREEQIALPPLALLGPLARGERTAEMHAILLLTDSLRAELPRMLEEHKAIRAATIRLEEVARAAGNASVARFAETLKVHAQNEEEITYPAAILVGDLVRMPAPDGAAASEGHGAARKCDMHDPKPR